MRSKTYVPFLGAVALVAAYGSLLGSGFVPAPAFPEAPVEATTVAIGGAPDLLPVRFAPDTVRYGFEDRPSACAWDAQLPNPYEGLTFASTPFFASCRTPNGSWGLIARDRSNAGRVSEIVVQLANKAASVSVQSFKNGGVHNPTLVAYDETGAEIGTASDGTMGDWATLKVESGDGNIASFGLRLHQSQSYLDNLEIVYAALDPTTRQDCMNGGWEGYGFANQGQCIRFVLTGQDSRGGNPGPGRS